MSIFADLQIRGQSDPNGVFCRLIKSGVTQVISNAEILSLASGYATRLEEHGTITGSIIPIILEHSADLYAAFIGASLVGAVPAFLAPLTRKQDPRLYADSLSALLSRLNAPVVISSTPADRSGARHATISPSAVAADTPRPPAKVAPDQTALIQHSSGTTGLKKGVELSHRQIMRHIENYSSMIGLTDKSTVVSWLPLYHDMGLLTAFLMPAVIGCRLVSLDALEWVSRPTILLEQLCEADNAYCWMPNFAFHHVARTDRGGRKWDLSRVRALINCSEPCRQEAARTFLERYEQDGLRRSQLAASYAMAETVFAVTQTSIDGVTAPGASDITRAFLSSGRPIPGCSVKVVARDGREADPGEPGEVWVQSETMFSSYYGEPGRAQNRFRDGWYQTGDVGVIENGELFVIGRIDDMVIVNGRKVLAHEVEEIISRMPGVNPGRVLAFGRDQSDIGSQELMVALELLPDFAPSRFNAGQMRQHVETLTGIRPGEVIFLPPRFLVKSSSGKIARKASRAKIDSIKAAEAQIFD